MNISTEDLYGAGYRNMATRLRRHAVKESGTGNTGWVVK